MANDKEVRREESMADNGKFKLNRRDFLRIAGIGAGAAAVATVSKPAAADAETFTAAPFSDPAPWPQNCSD